VQQRRIAFASQALQQPADMSLALPHLVGGLSLGNQSLLCFLQRDQIRTFSYRGGMRRFTLDTPSLERYTTRNFSESTLHFVFNVWEPYASRAQNFER
jgi:hypothetical protein